MNMNLSERRKLEKILASPLLASHARKPPQDENSVRYKITPQKPSRANVEEMAMLRRMIEIVDEVPASMPPIDVASFIPILKYEFPLNTELFLREAQAMVEQMITEYGMLPQFNARLTGFSFDVAAHRKDEACGNTGTKTVLVLRNHTSPAKVFRFPNQFGADTVIVANRPARREMGRPKVMERMCELRKRRPNMSFREMAQVIGYEMPKDCTGEHVLREVWVEKERQDRERRRARLREEAGA